LRSQTHRIAIVDLSLRGQDAHNQDGLRVLEQVRQLDPGCVTLIVTGFATVELAVSVLTEYHAFTCLRKETFQRSQFRELIRQALASPQSLANSERGIQEERLAAPTQDARSDAVKTTDLALVVEDDTGWRSILAELLLDAGFQVRLCGSFGEALGYLRRGKFQLAVVDLSLSGHPGKSIDDWEETANGAELEGYRLLASTRAAGIPTVVVSGVARPDDIERAYQEQGIFAYIEKQAFDRRGFTRLVHEAQSVGRLGSELDVLTDREREVLELLTEGKTNKEIAEALVISTNTVKRHIKSIFSKLDIHTRSAAAAKMAAH
jgi:RNA polymerase sigma factor (sigma-70 family)